MILKKIEQQYFQNMEQLNDYVKVWIKRADIINVSPVGGGYVLFYWEDHEKK